MSKDLSNRRLKLLRAEVDLDFAGLVPALEAGAKVVLITDEELASDLDPDVLRRIGGMVMLCRNYGAVVTFAWQDQMIEIKSWAQSAQ
jgi:hypothetical protein